MVSHLSTPFYKFLYFFEKRCNSRNPLKIRVSRPSTTCIFSFFDYFQKNISKNISFPQSNIQVFSVTNTEFQFPALPLYTAPSPHNLVCGLPVSGKERLPGLITSTPFFFSTTGLWVCPKQTISQPLAAASSETP